MVTATIAGNISREATTPSGNIFGEAMRTTIQRACSPIGYAGGMNLYAYVGGDPVNAIDPWGLTSTVTRDREVCGMACEVLNQLFANFNYFATVVMPMTQMSFADWSSEGPPECTRADSGGSILDALPDPHFDLPSLPDGFVDFSAGLGDALLFGTGDSLRGFLGIDGGVDLGSGSYKAGGWTSFAFGASRVGYAAAAKGYSVVASSGAAASAFRESIKAAGRLGMGRGGRAPNLAKYAPDAQLRAAAGRTSPFVNAAGAGVAAAGAYGGLGAGCN